MALEGNYNVVIKTPMGDQKGGMALKQDGNTVSGDMSGSFGNTPIEDGAVDGDTVTWKTKVTNPMTLTLEFSGNYDGEGISGKVKLGTFGVSTFSATPA